MEQGAARHWAGLRATSEGLQIVLLGSDGEPVEVMRVANAFQALVRVIKRWRSAHAFDPSTAVFCVEHGSMLALPVLESFLERGWEVFILAPQHESGDKGEAPTIPDVADLVRHAMRAQVPKEPLSLAHLRAGKVERLRERRAELAALRSGLHGNGSGRNRHVEDELRREFERMDRRHMQVIDKLLSRLDTLIDLQHQHVYEGRD